jgi:Na+/proline symporter
MLFNIFITMFLVFQHYQHKKRINWLLVSWFGLNLAFQVAVLYNTATRGAILGLIGGLLVFALIVALFEKKNPLLRKSAIGILVAVLVLIGGFFAIRNTDFVKKSQTLNRFATLSI